MAVRATARTESPGQLSGQAASDLLGHLLQIEPVDQAVDREEGLSLFVGAVDLLRNVDRSDPEKLQQPQNVDRIAQISGDAGRIVHAEDIERRGSACRRLKQRLDPGPALN